jgi:uncharacterized protein (DUF952 family)
MSPGKPHPEPEVLYHLCPFQPDEELPAFYHPESLEREGFIHLSTAEQLARTANRFFQQFAEVQVLAIATARVEAEIRWEESEPGEAPFPHLYGELPREAVVWRKSWRREVSGEYAHPPLEPAS